ncbi:hypothetical protein ACQJBY_015327 [Aegilops geniculata]
MSGSPVVPPFVSQIPSTDQSSLLPPTVREADMSHQSDTSSCSDDSDDSTTIDPTGIYTMEDLISEQSIFHNLLEQINVKIQAKIKPQQAGASRRGSRKYIVRNREEGHEQLVADYFAEHPTYTDEQFRTRYRMRRPLFLRIVRALGEWSPYFTERRDGLNRQGLTPLQKCTVAIRILALGSPSGVTDKYVEIGFSTVMNCLEQFVDGVINMFGEEYLRSPTSVDMQRLLQMGETRGFPGMLGSIGCMHWEWKKCPVKWVRHLTHSDHGVVNIILEAVASQDLWIWHAFFGVVGSHSDITMLNQSHLFTDVLKGQGPHVQFSINRRQYSMGYYLADGAYPEWPVFIKAMPLPQTEKDRLFAQYQKGARNDVQRAFRLLESRFPIVRGPTKFFQKATLGKIMQVCIILHNMTLEDEQDRASACFDSNEISEKPVAALSNIKYGPTDHFADLLRRNASICANSTDNQLRRDLIEHVWQQFGPFGDT